MKKIIICYFVFLITISLKAQTLYLEHDASDTKQLTSDWKLSLRTQKYHKTFLYSYPVYGRSVLIFSSPDKQMYAQNLPMSQIVNYDVKTIQQISQLTDSMNEEQRLDYFLGYKNYYIVIKNSNLQTFDLIKVFIDTPVKSMSSEIKWND